LAAVAEVVVYKEHVMTTILRVDASSRSQGSHSRMLGDKIEHALLACNPNARVLRRELASAPIEHIRTTTIQGYYTPTEAMTAELRDATAISDAVISEVKSADTLLITTPMYNFSIPSALKAWIDQLVRIGHTFAYDGSNFTGLLPGKKAVIAIAYGAGGYLRGGPFSGADFVQPYLRFLLNFLGVQDVRFLGIEQTTADAATIADETQRAEAEIQRMLAA
jgi:FMN-dependent NADH-azoreductase